MVEKIKTEVDRLLLILMVNEKFPIDFYKIEFFLLSERKVVYLLSLLSSTLQFPQC